MGHVLHYSVEGSVQEKYQVGCQCQRVRAIALLQAILLTVCATLSVLNQDGSYAPSPWLTRRGTKHELVLDVKAAALHALSLRPTPAQTPVMPSGQQLMTQQVQQARQQSSLLQQVVQQFQKQPMQQLDRQHVQPDPTQGVHELSPASNVTPFFHDVSEDPDLEEARDEFIKEKPGLAIPVEVQKKSGKVWHDVLVAAAVRLTASEEVSARQSAMGWLVRLVFTLTDEAGKELVQAGAVQASLQFLQRETDITDDQSRLLAMQLCLRLHHRGLLPANLLLEANIHQQLIDMFTKPGQAQ